MKRMTSAAVNQHHFAECSEAVAHHESRGCSSLQREMGIKSTIFKAASVGSICVADEGARSRWISFHVQTKDCLLTGFVTTDGSEQKPPAQHLHYLYCVAFELLSETGESIPSAAQKHTYFIAISLSGNIFSNHFPTWFFRDGKIPYPMKWNDLENSISPKMPWWGFLSTSIADTVFIYFSGSLVPKSKPKITQSLCES